MPLCQEHGESIALHDGHTVTTELVRHFFGVCLTPKRVTSSDENTFFGILNKEKVGT